MKQLNHKLFHLLSKLSKRQALTISVFIAFVMFALVLLFFWHNFQDEKTTQLQKSNLDAQTILDASYGRLTSQLAIASPLSIMFADHTKVKAYVQANQVIDFAQATPELTTKLKSLGAYLVLIQNAQQETLYQTKILTAINQSAPKLITNLNKGASFKALTWQLYFHSEQKQFLTVMHAPIFIKNQYKGAVVLAFPISKAKFTDATMNFQLIAFKHKDETTSQTLTETQSSIHPQAQLMINLLQGQLLTDTYFQQKQEYGIRYYQLQQLSKQRFIAKQININQQWDLYLLTNIDPIFAALDEEIAEAKYDLLLVLLFFVITTGLLQHYYLVLELSISDPLTGLKNRRHLNEHLSNIKEIFKRGRIEYIGAVSLDIDKFKLINDTYGHDVGDKVIKALATHMLNSARKSDLVYRVGGEEFLIISQGEPLANLHLFAERLREEVEQLPYLSLGLKQGFTVSIGVAMLEQQESLQQFIKKADLKLYQAKNSGRNKVLS